MKRLRIVVFVSYFFSCQSSVPNDVLPPQKMQSVMWDMMQADALTDYYSNKDSSFRKLSRHVDYYQKVFAIHNISKGEFTRSLNYYENHPAALKKILDSLQSFGERLQKDSVKKTYNPIGNDTTKRKLIRTVQQP